jgi:preprotein translocase subunit YajC
MIGVMLCIFYFLMYRPQKKKQQQHDKMLAAIGRGDTVVSAGGFFGKVSDVLEDSFIVEIAEGVRVRIMKNSISVRRETTDAKPKSVRPKKRRRRRVEGGEELQSLPGAEETGEVTPDESEVLIETDAAEPADGDDETVISPDEDDAAGEPKGEEDSSGGAEDDKKG